MQRDADFLQTVLEERPGEWVSHSDLLKWSFAARDCGLTVHSRASQLRTERGLNVECKTERAWNPATQKYSGRKLSFYRLTGKPSRAETERGGELPVPVEGDKSRAPRSVSALKDASGTAPRSASGSPRSESRPDAAGSGLTGTFGAPAPLPVPLFDMPKKAAWA